MKLWNSNYEIALRHLWHSKGRGSWKFCCLQGSACAYSNRHLLVLNFGIRFVNRNMVTLTSTSWEAASLGCITFSCKKKQHQSQIKVAEQQWVWAWHCCSATALTGAQQIFPFSRRSNIYSEEQNHLFLKSTPALTLVGATPDAGDQLWSSKTFNQFSAREEELSRT